MDLADICKNWRDSRRIAYESGDERVTYGRLWETAVSLAAFLQEGSGAVAILDRKSPVTVTAVAACFLSGRPYCIIEPELPASQVRRRLATAGVTLTLDFAPEADIPSLTGEELARVMETKVQGFVPASDEERTVYILFTSGSTGTPKGVCITAANIVNFLRWLDGIGEIQPFGDGRYLSATVFSFDLSVFDLYYCWHRGGTLCIPKRDIHRELGAYMEELVSMGGTNLICTPTYLKYCLSTPEFCRGRMETLSCVILCGEELQSHTVKKFFTRFPDACLINAYGPTEATCAVTLSPICREDAHRHPLPMGDLDRAALTVTVEQDGVPCPDGTEGEIVLVGESVGAGYLGGTGGFFTKDGRRGYRTGDVGFIQDGQLFFRHRADDQIKFKGYRIEPGEIEAVLEEHEGIRQAAVLPKKTADGKILRLTAFIAGHLTAEEVRDYLTGRLPAYMIPGQIVMRDDLPVTPSGKCDRKKLAEEM